MQKNTLRIIGNKAVLNIRERMCETPEELLASDNFRSILVNCLDHLKSKNSPLIEIFPNSEYDDESVTDFITTLSSLVNHEKKLVPHIFKKSEQYLKDLDKLTKFVEHLYDYWRHFDRFIVNDSEGDRLDKRPYRTFHETIEQLTHLVRTIYRQIQQNITGTSPTVYRQVPAGAEIAVISLPKNIPYSGAKYKKLKAIPVIRQMLIYPPLVIQQPMNKRTGHFKRIQVNPVDLIDLNQDDWICYPAKVGKLLIMVYFHLDFFELGFSMCNLFQIADNSDLKRKPDALFIYGAPGDVLDGLADYPTVFFDDQDNGIFVGAVPNRPEFGYFGYLKKMMLTLHNSIVMKNGNLPFHGAMIKILLQGNKEATILMMGDTGAGKSETLEAFRVLGEKHIRELTIIADDMGSIELDSEGCPLGYGTEIGAFLRLDDLQSGYAFGHLDRSIIMNPNQVNARIVIPVTSFDTIIQGHKIDYILYANNYEEVDGDHPVIEQFNTTKWALDIFREGAVMSKGTTTTSGLVHSYFANIFGPPEYKSIHDEIAEKYFKAFFKQNIYVGQMRTRLGIPGHESSGPREAALELLRIIGVTDYK